VQNTVALSYAVAPGVQGGLGHHAAQVLEACESSLPTVGVFAPRPLHGGARVRCHSPPSFVPAWRRRYSWRRYFQGPAQLEHDRLFGKWLAGRLNDEIAGCYLFTQIALETLTSLEPRGTASLLDNPNGHIRHYREVVQREAGAWLSTRYPAHPSSQMVARVEEEYDLASVIRVASSWAARSLVSRGVDSRRIAVVPLTVDLARFAVGRRRESTDDNLRVLFVGSLSLGKGFQYLLEGLRRLKTRHVSLRLVGSTGDPWCRRLLARLSSGLDVTVTPGDPGDAYRDSDVLVLPTLHDGFGLVVAEAMASGLPVITTDCCGASELLREGQSGWIISPGDSDQIAGALERAAVGRRNLAEMGGVASRDIARTIAPNRTRLRTVIREVFACAADDRAPIVGTSIQQGIDSRCG